MENEEIRPLKELIEIIKKNAVAHAAEANHCYVVEALEAIDSRLEALEGHRQA